MSKEIEESYEHCQDLDINWVMVPYFLLLIFGGCAVTGAFVITLLCR